MTRIGSRILFVLALMVAGLQFAHAADVRATIPFDFTVNQRTFAAGTYYVSQDSTESRFLTIRSAIGHNVVIVLAKSVDSRFQQPSLVFDHDGDSYSLRSVRDGSREFSVSSNRKHGKVAQSIVPMPGTGGR